MPLRIMDGTGPTEAKGTRGTCMMIVIMLLRFLDVATRTAYACMMRSPGIMDAISARIDIGTTDAGMRNSTMEMASPTEATETADTRLNPSMMMSMSMSMMIMMMMTLRNMQARAQ